MDGYLLLAYSMELLEVMASKSWDGYWSPAGYWVCWLLAAVEGAAEHEGRS
jgi:hypothetical protein